MALQPTTHWPNLSHGLGQPHDEWKSVISYVFGRIEEPDIGDH